jgi:Fe-Mn family superoxide dismutase
MLAFLMTGTLGLQLASPTRLQRAAVRMSAPVNADDLDELKARYMPDLVTQQPDRRAAIGLAVAAGGMSMLNALPAFAEDGMFSVPPLPYPYDALEPTIDAATMKFHHDFHHQAYVNNLNKAMAGKPAATVASLMPGAKAAKLNNAGGGHYNHVTAPRQFFQAPYLPRVW